MRGALIAFVGLDGSGKSTQSKLLVKNLRDRGVQSTYLSASSLVKDRFSDPTEIFTIIDSMQDLTKSLFWASIDNEYVSRALTLANQGVTVVLDRWDESFLAYNLRIGELSTQPNLVYALGQTVYKGIIPDRTIWLDISPEQSINRLTERDGALHGESLEHLRSNYQFYHDLASKRGWARLDGNITPELLMREILQSVNPILIDELQSAYENNTLQDKE